MIPSIELRSSGASSGGRMRYFWRIITSPKNNSILARLSPAHCRFPIEKGTACSRVVWKDSFDKSLLEAGISFCVPYWAFFHQPSRISQGEIRPFYRIHCCSSSHWRFEQEWASSPGWIGHGPASTNNQFHDWLFFNLRINWPPYRQWFDGQHWVGGYWPRCSSVIAAEVYGIFGRSDIEISPSRPITEWISARMRSCNEG